MVFTMGAQREGQNGTKENRGEERAPHTLQCVAMAWRSPLESATKENISKSEENYQSRQRTDFLREKRFDQT